MDKVKDFIKDNKKIIIPVAIVLILLIAVGIYFVSQPNTDTNKKAENQTEEKVDISKDDKTEEDKNKDSEDKKDTADNPSADKPANNGNASSNGGDGGSSNHGGNSSASKPSAPSHTHSWKDHTATKQVWVSNWVEEPVYETQKVQVGQTYTCNCGYQTTSAFAIEDHCAQHLINGEPDNWGAMPRYENQQVQVGTNRVDKGHYDTQTYVDYKYCDCGATK